MNDDELAALLRSPALSLAPPPDLIAGVQRGARRVRRRRAAGTALLSLVLLAGAVTVGPQLIRNLTGGPGDGEQFARLAADSRFPAATTPVLLLAQLHGGEVLTWFEGNHWCTASARADLNRACSRNIGAQVPPFAFLRGPRTESLTVDDDFLVAGVLGSQVVAVQVRLSDGSTARARTAQPLNFPRPVWWLAVPQGVTVQGYTALDAADKPVADRTG